MGVLLNHAPGVPVLRYQPTLALSTYTMSGHPSCFATREGTRGGNTTARVTGKAECSIVTQQNTKPRIIITPRTMSMSTIALALTLKATDDTTSSSDPNTNSRAGPMFVNTLILPTRSA